MFAYQSLETETVPCDFCGSASHEELFTGDRYEMGIRTVICKACGLVFTNPRPSAADMARFYQSHYRDFYESTDRPDKDYIEKGEFEFRASVVFNHLKPILLEEKRFGDHLRVLDVGCSEGSVLKKISESFPGKVDAFGVEPSLTFSDFARSHSGAEIFTGTLEQFVARRSESTPFDLVILNHVLEHFLSPTTQLNLIRQVLSENGVLFVEVPDIMGEWSGKPMIHLAHLYQFSEPSLRALLAKTGFTPERLVHQGNHLHPWAMTAISTQSAKRMPELQSASEIQFQASEIRRKFNGQSPSPAPRLNLARRVKSFLRNRKTGGK